MAKKPHNPVRSRSHYRPTVAGWLFLIVACIVGAASVRAGAAAMIHLLAGAMMGALLLSAFMARRMVASIRVSRDMPDRVWQNQTVHLGYYLRNIRRRACLGIGIDEIAPTGITSASGYCLNLPGRSTFRSGARFAARQRGRIRMEGIRVSTSFPFGLLYACRSIDRPANVVVWPSRGRLLKQLLYRGAAETSTAAPSPATGGSDEFFGLREYREGDNPRWISWRKSAGRRMLVLREMARPLPDSVWIIIDTFVEDSRPEALTDRERLIRFAATLIDHAFARGYDVGLTLAYGGRARIFPPAAGKRQRSRLLDALADIDLNDHIDLDAVLSASRRSRLRQSQTFLIRPGDWTDPAVLHRLRRACRHLTIVTPRELGEVFRDEPLGADVAPDDISSRPGRRPKREAPCR